ncbi:MAG TPA: hypothetical protein VNR39_12215 [Pseudolabrys sp.]|nr:hypothetical protein [Pseudolabrys sp.]
MLSGDLAAHLSEALEIPTGTVKDVAKALRAGGLLSVKGRGPRSGARMTERDVVNWTLGLIVDKPHGADLAGVVQYCRDLHTADVMRFGLDDLEGFFSATPGLALELIIRELRPGGRLATRTEPLNINAAINTRGDSVITSFRPGDVPEKGVRVAMQTFGRELDYTAPVNKSVSLNMPFFTGIADALGPP